MIIWDDAKQQAVITLEFRTQVHKVRLSRSRIVVALQNSIHVYAFSSPPQKLSVFETADNYNGLCSLGTDIIAFPGTAAGRVQLVGVKTGNVSIIAAHSSTLKAIELSPDGQVLATASETVCPTLSQSDTASLSDRVNRALLFVYLRRAIARESPSCAVVLTMLQYIPLAYPQTTCFLLLHPTNRLSTSLISPIHRESPKMDILVHNSER